MTRQEMYNFVAEKIIKQGKVSFSPDKGCMYRGPDGTRCAAGWLIPDENYHPSMEGSCFRSKYWLDTVPEEVDAALPKYLKENSEFVRALQTCHDLISPEDPAFLDKFQRNMIGVANVYELDYTMLAFFESSN